VGLPGPWQVQSVLAATPVSRTWRVLLGETPAVLRVDEPGARCLGLNRRDEPLVLRAVTAAGLGPACLGADPDRGQLLTEWLPGRAWTAADLRQPGNLRQAAALLRRVHGLPIRGPVVDLKAAIARYGEHAGPAGSALEAVAREQLARARALDTDGPLPVQLPCLCHNDPTPGNFIAGPDGVLRLIDWEYAGLCSPGFDLAGLALGAALGPGEAEWMLGAYLGRRPAAPELARHGAWEDLSQTLGLLWTAALAFPGPSGHAEPNT